MRADGDGRGVGVWQVGECGQEAAGVGIVIEEFAVLPAAGRHGSIENGCAVRLGDHPRLGPTEVDADDHIRSRG